MDKTKIFEKYKKEEDRLLIAKLFDKISSTEKQNKVQTIDFLSPIELRLLEDVLKLIGHKNYTIYGGIAEAQRKMIIMYPQKLDEVFEKDKFDYNSICNCIRITCNQENYTHKVYLGGILKLGIKREKVGDIIVFDGGADIVVNKEITKFLVSNLQELSRFKKSSVEIIDVKDIIQKEQEYKEMKIVVSSLRLDNIVAELSKTSRSKALEILKQERVLINYRNETKNTKLIQVSDIVTIRGVGKFIIDEILGNTKNGRYILSVRMFN